LRSVIKGIVAVVGMLAVGWIVWKLLERQGNATDAQGNVIYKQNRGKPGDPKAGGTDQ
jgi:hypothetical protein